MKTKLSCTAMVLLGGLFLLTTHLASAAYKCVGADGALEYMDLPREGYECTEMRTVPAPTPATEAETEEQESEQADSGEDSDNAEDDPRQANCEIARKNLGLLQSEKDVIITDKDGNKTILGAEQRQTELERAQKDVDYWCN